LDIFTCFQHIISGYEILDDDVMAIARLRGEQLKQFDIPLCCIATLDEDEETPTRYAYVDDDFVLSVSKILDMLMWMMILYLV
jgi:hypothetical protein